MNLDMRTRRYFKSNGNISFKDKFTVVQISWDAGTVSLDHSFSMNFWRVLHVNHTAVYHYNQGKQFHHLQKQFLLKHVPVLRFYPHCNWSYTLLRF